MDVGWCLDDVWMMFGRLVRSIQVQHFQRRTVRYCCLQWLSTAEGLRLVQLKCCLLKARQSLPMPARRRIQKSVACPGVQISDHSDLEFRPQTVMLSVLSVHVCHLLGFFVIHCGSMALVHYIYIYNLYSVRLFGKMGATGGTWPCGIAASTRAPNGMGGKKDAWNQSDQGHSYILRGFLRWHRWLATPGSRPWMAKANSMFIHSGSWTERFHASPFFWVIFRTFGKLIYYNLLKFRSFCQAWRLVATLRHCFLPPGVWPQDIPRLSRTASNEHEGLQWVTVACKAD